MTVQPEADPELSRGVGGGGPLTYNAGQLSLFIWQKGGFLRDLAQ